MNLLNIENLSRRKGSKLYYNILLKLAMFWALQSKNTLPTNKDQQTLLIKYYQYKKPG